MLPGPQAEPGTSLPAAAASPRLRLGSQRGSAWAAAAGSPRVSAAAAERGAGTPERAGSSAPVAASGLSSLSLHPPSAEPRPQKRAQWREGKKKKKKEQRRGPQRAPPPAPRARAAGVPRPASRGGRPCSARPASRSSAARGFPGPRAWPRECRPRAHSAAPPTPRRRQGVLSLSLFLSSFFFPGILKLQPGSPTRRFPGHRSFLRH